jgi:predicted DNA repair protein MutK
MITVVVYGLVGGIVKLDDLGLFLSKKEGSGFLQALGRGILRVAPWLMKALSIFGTAAMFLVGGGILAHGIPGLGSWIHHLTEDLGGFLEMLTSMLLNGGFGIVAGVIALGIITIVQRMFGAKGAAEAH